MPNYVEPGDMLWNGAIATPQFARAYNRVTDKILSFERAGRAAPEYLINGRHNLMASVSNAYHRWHKAATRI